jgi:hypothetical protein
MAREILRELDADVTRLLMAGASMVASDEGLLARSAQVRELAEKAPALQKLSQQVSATLSVGAKGAASELLALAAMSAQVRGAQARPAERAGTLVALAPRSKLDTPLASGAADRIYRALTGASDEPENVLETALRDGAIVDLRFARLVVNLVGGGIDDDVVVRVVKAYGEEAVRSIEEGFDPKGGITDATRLEIIAAVRGASALETVTRAFEEGSPEVRAEALRQWAELDPSGARLAALSRGVTDRSGLVVEKAIEILGAMRGSDEALDALIALLASPEHQDNAATALASFEHREIAERLLRALTPELRALSDRRAPRAKKGAAKGAAAAAKKDEETRLRAHEDAVNHCTFLVQVLGAHRTEAVEDALFALWRESRCDNVRLAAGEALSTCAREDVRESLLKGIESKSWRERELAIRALLGDEAGRFERVAPYFASERLATKLGRSVANALLTELTDGADGDEREAPKGLDPRWEGAVVPLMEHEELADAALAVLAGMNSAQLFNWAEKQLTNPKRVGRALEAFELLGDGRATPLIVRLLEAPKLALAGSYYLTSALRALDDPSAAAPLRAFIAKLDSKKQKAWIGKSLAETAGFLERVR